ncbi:MAG: peptidoglycan-binding domain-containing protein [Acidiferrobacter sp.]
MSRSSGPLFSKRTLLGIALASALPIVAFAQTSNTPSSSAQTGSSHSMMGNGSMGTPNNTSATPMKGKPAGSARVKSIQAALNRKEHAHLAVDGLMGKQTRTALEKFQKAHGIKPSGRPTKATQKALGM